MKKSVFTRSELLFVSLLALALGIRQLATALVSAFISNYAQTLHNETVTLAAVSLGVFGLFQAIFQIPFGIWNDKYNKKIVLLLGLGMLAVGLILSAVTNNEYIFIFSRGLQGAGAIASSTFAWLSIGVEESKMSNAINIAGIAIGLASAIGLSFGTIFRSVFTYDQLTYIDAACVIISFLLILFFLKSPQKESNNSKNKCKLDKEFWIYLRKLLDNKLFTLLNLLSFIANYIIMAIFFIIPEYLSKLTGSGGMWKVFVPATIIAVILMRFSIKFINNGKTGEIFVGTLALIFIGVFLYNWNNQLIYLVVGTTLFMIGYNVLITLIPTITNKMVDDTYRGTINGVINTFLYFGSFVGAVVTGDIWQAIGAKYSLYSLIGIALVALLVGIFLYFTSKELREIR